VSSKVSGTGTRSRVCQPFQVYTISMNSLYLFVIVMTIILPPLCNFAALRRDQCCSSTFVFFYNRRSKLIIAFRLVHFHDCIPICVQKHPRTFLSVFIVARILYCGDANFAVTLYTCKLVNIVCLVLRIRLWALSLRQSHRQHQRSLERHTYRQTDGLLYSRDYRRRE